MRRARRDMEDPRVVPDEAANPLTSTSVDAADGLSPGMSMKANFIEDEIWKMHRDDAMTAGMIGAILGLAFTVLLTLVIGVNIWMATIAH